MKFVLIPAGSIPGNGIPSLSSRKGWSMRKTAVYICLCVLAMLLAPAWTGHGASFYVSATANNDNDGLSEENAFDSLWYAVALASGRADIERVIVTGKLSFPSVINWNDTSSREILITGKAHAADHERAVLTYTGDAFSCGITISGKSKIRFEHIEISGTTDASGLCVRDGAMVTLGSGATITRNHNAGDGGGVYVSTSGILVMEDGAEISHNECSTYVYGLDGAKEMQGRGGGLYLSDGVVIIYGGRIAHNTVDGAGGGIFIGGGHLIRHGGVITENTACAGGGIYKAYGDTYVSGKGNVGIRGNTPNDVESGSE